jgi:hypothetical protein
MNNLKMKSRNSEKGSASAKLIITLTILFLFAHAGYNYVPVAYEGQNFKQDMQTAVVQGMAPPLGVTQTDMVKGRLQKAMVSNHIPSDAVVVVKPANSTMTAQVAYTKQVSILPFGLYNYNYQFNHTATPTGFLLKD